MMPTKMTSHSLALLVLVTATFTHLGQAATCNTHIDITNTNSILVSSEEPGFEKEKVPVECCQNETGSAWCPKKDDTNSFLEVRMDKPILIGKIRIYTPTRAVNKYPTQFMKTFDLKLKLPDVDSYISVAKDIPAIHNQTIASSVINIIPPQFTQILRIEPKTSQMLPCFKLQLYTCDLATLCPSDFCKNGGVCNGLNTCDCTGTNEFYGSQCQYTVAKIPKSLTEFVKVTTTSVITTTFTLTFHGQVSVTKDNGVTSMVIPSGSTVDMPFDPQGPCLKDLDTCVSGFSISVVFSFKSLDKRRTYVLSSGGSGADYNVVKGIQLFFQNNMVYCVVGTSDKMWIFNAPITQLISMKWYEMTVTWSPGRGLQLLLEGKVIGSAVKPFERRATVLTHTTVLGFTIRTTLSVLSVNRVFIVPMFWTEAERAGIHRGQPHPVTTGVPTTTTSTTTTTTKATTTLGPVPECKAALGLTSGGIKDDQITVSSSQPGHGKEKVRAGCCENEEDGAWCADPTDTKPWVQIDLTKPKALSALSFKLPARTSNTVIPQNYVQVVRMDYDDPYDNTTSMDVYSNNIPVTKNATVSYLIALNPKIVTSSIRMYVTKAHGDACFRFELIGCDPEDLCPPNFCQNNGTCKGDMQCKCQDGYYGDRCELTKTQITPTETKFEDIVNKTLVTNTGQNLTVDGNVTIVKENKTTNVIQVTDGGTVTFPEDNCFKDLTSCTSGFTLTLVVKVTVSTDDDLTILTSGGDNKDSAGLALIYNKLRQTLTFTVKDQTRSWTILVKPFTWEETHWYKLTLTWSPISGSKIIVNDRILGTILGGTPTTPKTTTKNLCIGCNYVGTTTTTTTSTTTTIRTIWVKSVTKVHVFVTELVRAHIVDVTKDTTPPQPKECTDNRKDIVFKNTTDTEVVTSLGNVKAHGNLSIIKENNDVILVLDQTGEYIEVSNTGFPCIDDITTCKSNLTYRITVRFNKINIQPNVILSSGGDLADSTGISLYYYHGSLNFWVKDGDMVWMAIYRHTLTTGVWYTMDASWSHVTGIQLRLDGSDLKAVIRNGHPASPTTQKHPLHIAKSPSPEKNMTSIMDVLVFRVWTKTVDELVDLGCTDDLTVDNPPPRPVTTAAPTTTITTAPSTEPPLTETRVTFTKIVDKTIVTTHTNFTFVGTVTLEKVTVGQVLVLSKPGSYIDIGKTGVPCIDDVSSCTSGFNFRIVFSLTNIDTQPQVIISSGADTSQGKGLTVRYHNKELIIYIKRNSNTIIGTFTYELKSTYWYTLDVSWSVQDGLKIHINNVILGGTIKTLPHPQVTVTYTLLIGKSPESNNTTVMKVFEIDLWTRIYTRITRKRLELPSIRFPTTRDPQARALPTPTVCNPNDLDPTTKMAYDLTFVDVGNGVAVTPEAVFEATGNSKLDKQNGNKLTLYGGDDGVELTCIPCLSNQLKCDDGFTLLMKLYLEDYCPRVYLLDAIQDSRKDMGIQLSIQDGQFKVLLQAAYKKWVLNVPYTVQAGGTYHIQVSWHPGEYVVLSVNGKTMGNATALSLPFFFYGESRPMRIGNAWREVSTCKTTISDMFAFMEFRDVMPIIKETTGAPSTTTPIPPPTTTQAVSDTTDDDNSKGTPEYSWTLVSVTRQIIASRELTLEVIGGPKSDTTGLVLTRPNQYIKIPSLKNTCLTNPDKCTRGFTVQIDINLTILEEGSVIFTSGAENPNAPGITMIYRYGHIHVIASTPTRSWYLTVSRTVIKTRTFCTIHVSWSATTTLKLFINKLLVSVADPVIPHVDTTIKVTTDLIIGGGTGTCIVKEVHIWLVHIEILISIGVVDIQGPTTMPSTAEPTTIAPTTAMPKTPAATTASPTTAAPTTAAPTTAAPTTVEPTTAAPKTAEPTTSAPTTKKAADTTARPSTEPPQITDDSTTLSGQCPSGCRAIDLCYTPPPSTPPTTPAPTTQPPSPPSTTAAPITQAPPLTKSTTTTTTTPSTTTTTTPSTTTTTTTPTTTTTTPTTTTTTTPTTTTTTPTTTTTTTTPTTTEIGCPDLSASLMLIPATDNNGQALMTCVLSAIPDRNVEVQFTWSVIGHTKEWSATIQSPDKAAPLMVSTMDIKIENRKIMCSAKARYLVSGAQWCSNKIVSNTVHAKIQLTTTGIITVVEGRENQTVGVVTTVPPTSYCLPEDNGRCTVVITTIIETERNEIRCSRREIVPQAVLGVSTIGTGNSAICGILVTKDNWAKVISIPVKATIDKVRDRDWIRKLKISITVTGEITRRTYTKLIGEVRVKVINRDRRATCSSVNDPHMTTFDGVRYNNFIPGEFVLYRHVTMQYEVRTNYRLCNTRRRNGPTCNLGVAVRSGDDVISFTTDPRAWGGNSVISVQLYLNGELTPGTRIIRIGCGQKYEVHLPHGTIITIVSQRKPFINVYVKATSTDFDQTEGLCGNFNGNRGDDLQGVSGRYVNRFSMKWKQTITMFQGVAAMILPPPPTYCSCQTNYAPMCSPGLDVYHCHTTSRQWTEVTRVIIQYARRSMVRGRYRRAVDDDTVIDDGNQIEDGTEIWSQTNATEYCTDFIENNNLVDKCRDYLDVNQTSESIRNCAEDLQAMGEKAWASSHLDHIIEECLTDAQQNPDTWVNGTDDEPAGPPKKIINGLCTVDCGQHGSCAQGACECSDGWTGVKCDVNKQTKPDVMKADVPCDLLESSCRSVRIDGNNFVQSDKLKCTFKFVEVKDTVTPTRDTNLVVDAEFVSMYHVICRQPETLEETRSAVITVSNDGETPSDESYLHVVHKSSCQFCRMSGDKSGASCNYLENACIIDGQCYAKNEKFEKDPCYRCDPNVNKSLWTRISEPQCLATQSPAVKTSAVSTDEDDNHTTIIVLSVVCGILALVIVSIAIMVCKMQKKSPKDQHLYAAPNQPAFRPFDVNRSKVTQPSKIGDVSEMPDADRLNTYVNPTFQE